MVVHDNFTRSPYLGAGLGDRVNLDGAQDFDICFCVLLNAADNFFSGGGGDCLHPNLRFF